MIQRTMESKAGKGRRELAGANVNRAIANLITRLFGVLIKLNRNNGAIASCVDVRGKEAYFS